MGLLVKLSWNAKVVMLASASPLVVADASFCDVLMLLSAMCSCTVLPYVMLTSAMQGRKCGCCIHYRTLLLAGAHGCYTGHCC